MSLTEAKIKQLKPAERSFFVADQDGLSLKVDTNGNKSWSYRYFDPNTQTRRRKKLGDYPALNLKQARQKRDEYQLEFSRSPDFKHNHLCFKHVVDEWLNFKSHHFPNAHPRCGVVELARIAMQRDALPLLGDRIFSELKRFDLVMIIRKIEMRNVKEPVLKMASYLNQLYDYAVAMGYCEINLANQLNKVLKEQKIKQHYPYLTANDLPTFLKRIDQDTSHPIVKKALLFKLYTGVRGAEILSAQPHHFDLENKIWNIPAIHVKQFRRKVLLGFDVPDYQVPLSEPALHILLSALQWSAGDQFVFASPKKANSPLHFNTLNSMIRRLGYEKGQLSAHGLRSTMSTILNDSGHFEASWIEAQLSHVDQNKTRASYNHAQYLEQRQRMMQWWADFIDNKRTSA